MAVLAVAALAGLDPAGRADEAAPPMLMPRFTHAPLPEPMVLTGSFGEHRNSHIHAGLDLSTGGEIGMPVYACEDGWIERVRAQGVGYGRSIYLHTRDGRLLVYGHLDGFDEPIASYIGAVQDSSGQYEQDLWPQKGELTVKAGQRLAWSGRSGTGSPHLHIEVRRVDMAYNPLRSGVVIADSSAPLLRSLTLEPLDEHSYVSRSAAPVTFDLSAALDTLVVEGRVRAVLVAVDPGERRAIMTPWSSGLEWEGARIEYRADSISWALDGGEVDYVFDLGRAAPFSKMAHSLWEDAGVRPRTMVTNLPDTANAVVIACAPGQPARALRLFTRDLAGHVTERTLWLRGPRAAERGPGSPRGEAARGAREFRFAALPERNVRVSYRGAPTGARDVTISVDGTLAEASLRAGVWSAVLRPPADAGSVRAAITGRDGAGAAWSDTSARYGLGRPRPGSVAMGREGRWSLPATAAFDRNALLLYRESERPAGTRELDPAGSAIELLPARTPLRAPATIELAADAARAAARAGIYLDRGEGEGWEFISGAHDPAGARLVGESRRLGRFAVFADTLAPRATPYAAAKRWKRGDYPTWALTAALADHGSGIDSRASAFLVDGRRVPSEFDAVRGELKWRPRVKPAAGTHRYVVVATDRAGNVTRVNGRFVLE